MKYLLSYANLLENHTDIADYERFYKHCLKCIKNNKNKHETIFKVLKLALNKFENSHLISMTLRLISNLDVKYNFEEKDLKRFLEDQKTREAVFKILSKIDDPEINKEALKYLYEETYESKDFFNFLTVMQRDVEIFLDIKDENLLRRQLLVMNHTKIFRNLDYFFKFLGSHDKSLCYLVYESIVLLIKESGNENPVCLGDSNSIILENKSTPVISLKEKMKIENISNFLIYFLPFMKEKEKVYSAILENDNQTIFNVLKTYAIFEGPLLISRHTHVYTTNCIYKESFRMNFIDEDPNFEFLFEEKAYKTHVDCIEL